MAAANTLDISMVSAGLTRSEASAVWKPFVDWLAASSSDYTVLGKLDFSDQPSQGVWDMDVRRAQGSKSIVFDTRPGSPSYHAWWRGDGDQVSVFLHGYDSIWLPEALLGVDKRAGLAEALFRASRHMTVSLHFNKGLAGSTPEAIRSARETATRSA